MLCSMRVPARAVPLILAAVLACAPAVLHAGTASNQLCGAAGQGAGCIGTVQGSGGEAPQADPAASNAFTNAAGSAFGSALGNALATPNSYPRYEHQAVKPVVGDGDDIPDKTDMGGAQDIIRMFRDPHPKPEKRIPPPASDKQVDATIRQLDPFITHPRSKAEPKLKDCASGCGCLRAGVMACTKNCSGTCYRLGGKDADPAGTGIDCSGLIAQENPCFWYKDCGKGKYGPELDCRPGNGWVCEGGGAERELTMLQQRGLDDKDKASQLNAGDVVFFSEGDDVAHVVQVTSEPACSDKGCMMAIVQAPQSGRPVEEAVIIIDKNGRTNKVVPNPKGGWIVQSTNLVMKGGGTPPAGPQTGGGNTQ